MLRAVARCLARGRPPARLAAHTSILIIRPDHLGDLLLSAPAIGLLRRGLPRARLSYLVGPWAEEVVRRGPPVDEVLTCPFPGFTRQPRSSALQPYQLLATEAARLRGRYAAALVLRPDHWWGALLAAAAGIPVRLGCAVPECAPFLTHALAWRKGSSFQSLGVALARRLLALTDGADLQAEPRVEPFRTRDDERAFAAMLLGEVAGPRTRPLVALHPGAGAGLKLWPAERWVAVGRELVSRFGARLLVTGAADERDLAQRIAAGVGAEALDVSGRTTLGQLAALLEQADLALGPDSGPLHLAAAVGTPTVRLFGPTDPRVFMPVGLAEQRALAVELPCQPCGYLANPPCGANLHPACVMGIGEEAVLEAAGALLAARRAGAR